MIRAKSYEKLSKLVKVTAKILLVPFFLDAVYTSLHGHRAVLLSRFISKPLNISPAFVIILVFLKLREGCRQRMR